MDSNIRWHFDPFNNAQPLRQREYPQQQNLPRSQSLNELRQQLDQPVSVMFFCYIIQALILDFFSWATKF
jgi:hypothetical protein